ncbi:8-oxo-dGTP pyrophosphatase MutT (NUDIX family) [Streptacidiphilus sp. MAP12-20]|uniref:NUDIX hydrolase n=1 Tax=Streptacidiphilus sp. MAP12-20 TaxID=3156299 RepID=UPI003512C7CF
MSDRLPSNWADRIAAQARGELPPVTPRRAATVVLLRSRAEAVQAYLLRRRTSMAFAGGAYAYPGGAVDPHDSGPELGWAGPDAAAWGERLGVAPDEARAVVCAAVRETFEESGVLLAGPDASSVVADVSGEEWRAARAALEAHELPFAEFLAKRGLVLRSDLLGAWSRWITPAFEERRYDTWFFVATVPDGQRTAEIPGEADRVVWLTPTEAVAHHAAGEFLMLPPTITTLRELERFASPAEALDAAAERRIEPIMAEARIEADGGYVVTWPGYPALSLRGRA